VVDVMHVIINFTIIGSEFHSKLQGKA